MSAGSLAWDWKHALMGAVNWGCPQPPPGLARGVTAAAQGTNYKHRVFGKT